MEDTPLGQIVNIRSETDREKIKNMTREQKRIRDSWRSRNVRSVSQMDGEETVKHVQQMLAAAFSGL